MSSDELTALKARHRIGDVLDRVGAEPPTRWLHNGDCMVRCPLPTHEDRTPSCIVHTTSDRFNCFGCGAHGDVLDLVQLTGHGRTVREAASWLDSGVITNPAQRSNDHRPPQSTPGGPQLERTSRARVLEVNHAAWQILIDPQRRRPAVRYLQHRGINISEVEQQVDRSLVGYPPAGQMGLTLELRERGFGDDEIVDAGWSFSRESSMIDRLHRRAVFAIRDEHDAILGFTARDIAGTARSKYINTPTTAAYTKSASLYIPTGYRRHQQIMLCEGPVDALAICAVKKVGDRSTAVAVLGTQLTTSQVRLLARCDPSTIIVVADGDAAGKSAGENWQRSLTAGNLSCVVVDTPPAADPASMYARSGSFDVAASTLHSRYGLAP